MKFSGVPKVRFEFGNFRLAVAYNVIGKTNDFNNKYLGIKLVFFAGVGEFIINK